MHSLELCDVKIAYDVTKLIKMSSELKDAESAYKYGLKYNEKNQEQLTMYPHSCSRFVRIPVQMS